MLAASAPALVANAGHALPLGIGWRAPHHEALLSELPPLAFIEVHSENYFAEGGEALAALLRAREHYAVSLHGVGLGLGSAVGLDATHLERLARLVARTEPALVSDHLAFARVAEGAPEGSLAAASAVVVHGGDLWPLPRSAAALDVLCAHVGQVQDRLKRALLVENICAYVALAGDELGEAAFLNALTRRSGCRLLLDVNNLVVNALNAGAVSEAAAAASATAVVQALDVGSVGEIHLAGFRAPDVRQRRLVIDDHSQPVREAVLAVYGAALARFGAQPTLLEWDVALPSLTALVAEAERAALFAAQVLNAKAPH